MTRSLRFRIVLLLALAVPLGGCLFRSHRPSVLMTNAPLKSAALPDLLAEINQNAAKVQTLNATVEISASTGGSKKGKITEYQNISGYILVRKPDMLRMIGLFPIVRNRAFDMVSNGKNFVLSIPAKTRFYVGRNDVAKPNPNATQTLENLRPQHIYDALLLRPVDPQDEIAVLEQSNQRITDPKTKKEILQPNYIVDVIRRLDHSWYLSRRITFDRTDLLPHRQRVYDRNGAVATDATYSDFKEYNGVLLPSVIQIWRPQEEYSVTLTIAKLTLNQPLTDDQFVLNQPPGAQVIQLDSAAPRTSASDGTPK
jgi:outer membrane lipoprotein-sorting protein